MCSFNFDQIFCSKLFRIRFCWAFKFLLLFAVPVCFTRITDTVLIKSIAIMCQTECIVTRYGENCLSNEPYFENYTKIDFSLFIQTHWLHFKIFSNKNIFFDKIFIFIQLDHFGILRESHFRSHNSPLNSFFIYWFMWMYASYECFLFVVIKKCVRFYFAF